MLNYKCRQYIGNISYPMFYMYQQTLHIVCSQQLKALTVCLTRSTRRTRRAAHCLRLLVALVNNC